MFCRLLGHRTPDRIGECPRCHGDLLGLTLIEKLAITQREYRTAMRLLLKYGRRS